MFDLTWEEKLSFLVEQDQTMKNVLIEKGIYSDSYHPELEKIHLHNARKLSVMIEKMGFPVLSNAGEKGVRLSWLIIQHSISWPDFIRECLLQMRLAAGQNDYPLELLAYTDDLVAFLEGRRQLYGTHTDWHEGERRPTPIEDPLKLESRRKSMGLPPLVHCSSVFNERPPRDPEKREQQFRQWLDKVGWRS